MPIPKIATNTVYVEGIPLDTSEREVARNSLSLLILFRYLPPLSRLQVYPSYSPGKEAWGESSLLLR